MSSKEKKNILTAEPGSWKQCERCTGGVKITIVCEMETGFDAHEGLIDLVFYWLLFSQFLPRGTETLEMNVGNNNANIPCSSQ